MSNCISLISCDGSCPNIHNIIGNDRTTLLPYIDNFVRVNGDIDCTYYVRNVRLIGFPIDTTEFLCSSILSSTRINLIDYGSIRYRINVLTYNGYPYIIRNNPITYNITYNAYQCLICQNAICTTYRPTSSPTIISQPNNSNAHTIQINNILTTIGLNIQVFPFGDLGAFVFRLFNGDTIEFEVERLTGPNLGVYSMLFDGSNYNVLFTPLTRVLPDRLPPTVSVSNIVNETTYTCLTEKSNEFSLESVTGVTGCSIDNTFVDYVPLNECDPITIFPMGVECSITNVLGVTGQTRTATLIVTGGTPPYSFDWENGNRTNSITNLPGGVYDVTVRDFFGDYIINTSCTLPSNCDGIEIITDLSYECIIVSGLTTGQAKLILSTSGGYRPYNYSGSINGVVTAITPNMIVNDSDLIVVNTKDVNNCSTSNQIKIKCPPSSPLTGNTNCELTSCPNSNTFQLEVSATTTSINSPVASAPNVPTVEFIFNLSSPSNYTGNVIGSYKIYDVDFPNTFLNLTTSFVSSPIIWTNFYRYAEYGSPSIKLNDYVEFGFTELTPNNPTNTDDSWTINITPWTQANYYSGQYSTPINGTFWNVGVTNIKIEISLFDDDGCIHTGSSTIQIPLESTTNTTTINF